MKTIIKNFLRRFGVQIKRFPDVDLRRRTMLMNNFGINKVLDIGANIGQYGTEIRRLGYKGRITSFEPMRKAYDVLKEKARRDPLWAAENFALGDVDGTSTLHISGNSWSSSIQDILPEHVQAKPESAYVNTEEITIKRLDSVFPNYYQSGDNIYLKIDTQGFEKNVLDGAENSLEKVKGIQMELSLLPLYANATLYKEMIDLLQEKGFDIYSFENGFFDQKTGRLLQFDGIFYKG